MALEQQRQSLDLLYCRSEVPSEISVVSTYVGDIMSWLHTNECHKKCHEAFLGAKATKKDLQLLWRFQTFGEFCLELIKHVHRWRSMKESQIN